MVCWCILGCHITELKVGLSRPRDERDRAEIRDPVQPQHGYSIDAIALCAKHAAQQRAGGLGREPARP